MRYRDVILYLFLGVCTTIVNVVVYWCCAHMFVLPIMVSTVIAWIFSVLFAYVTNRRWVFHSDASKMTDIAREILTFFGCRLATGVVDWGCMYAFVDLLGLNDVLIKIVANAVVIVLNYVTSKLIIFKRKKK